MSANAVASRRRWRVVAVIALFIVVFVASNVADHAVYHGMHVDKVYEKDWGRALRTVGYLPMWLLIALGLWLIDVDRLRGLGFRQITRRGGFITASTIIAGLVCEILKLTIRRERPREHDGLHVFRPWDEKWWSSAGLGLPSSHTMIAFAGAAAMSILFPRTAVIWLLAAAGCAWTRPMEAPS